jgi:16S rRNA (cytosine967-C5)-methyltransferase
VLVDAPCSGFGTLRRNPDLKWRFEEKDIAELNVKQAAILARAAKLTKAGGRLIYATCSLLQDENENIAEAFLSANPEFSLMPANDILSQQQIKLDTGKYLKLLPHLHGTDGFFAAVFERKAEAAKASSAKETTIEKLVVDQSEAKSAAKKVATKPKVAKVVKEKTVKPKVAKA